MDHPMQVRAAFRWIATTLPDRGTWWRHVAPAAEAAAAVEAAQVARQARSASAGRSGSLARTADMARRLQFSQALGTQGDGATGTSRIGSASRGRGYDGARDRARSQSPHAYVSPPSSSSSSLLSSSTLHLGSPHARARSASPTPVSVLVSRATSSRTGTSAGTPLAAHPPQHADYRAEAVSLLSSPSAATLASALRDREARLLSLPGYILSRLTPPRDARLPLLEHASLLLDGHTLTSIFTAWRRYAARNAAVRRRALANRARALLGHWREAAYRGAGQRQAGRLTSLLHEKYVLARAWFAWRREHAELLDEAARAPACAAHYHKHLLARVLGRWRSYCEFSKRIATRAERVRLHCLRHAFGAWTGLVDRRKHLSRQAGMLTALLRRRTLRFSLANWMFAWKDARNEQAAAQHAQASLLLRGFTGLCAGTGLQAREADAAIEARNRAAMVTILTAWRGALQRARSIHGFIALLRTRRLARFMAHWRAWSGSARRARTDGAALAGNLRRSRLASAVGFWRAKSAQGKRLSTLHGAAAGAIQRRALASVLHEWRARYHHERALVAATHACARSRKTAALAGWVAARTKVHRLARLHDQLSALHLPARSCIRMAWSHWRGALQFKATVRAFSARIEAAHDGALVRDSWGTWRARTADRKRLQELMRQAEGLSQHRQIAAAAHWWRTFTQRRSSDRLAVAQAQQSLLSVRARTLR